MQKNIDYKISKELGKNTKHFFLLNSGITREDDTMLGLTLAIEDDLGRFALLQWRTTKEGKCKCTKTFDAKSSAHYSIESCIKHSVLSLGQLTNWKKVGITKKKDLIYAKDVEDDLRIHIMDVILQYSNLKSILSKTKRREK